MNKSFVFTICVFAYTTAPATAQRLYIVGVPSEMDAATGTSILNATLDLVLRANEGDRIQIFDALNLQKVADVNVPSIPGKSNPKVRVVRLKEQIAGLKAYFMRCTSVRSGKSTQIKVPQFLELAGSAIKSSAGDTTVLLFGSPYYSDVRDAAFVFGKGYYPSDGHILATSKQSVFGASDKRDLLKGATVHYCHLNDVFETELERAAVRRFWKVYCDSLGTVLATFGPSREVVVERSLKNVADPVSQDHLDPQDTVIEMRKATVVLNRGPFSGSRERDDTRRYDTSQIAPMKANHQPVERDVNVESEIHAPSTPPEDLRQMLDDAEKSADHIIFAINWESSDPNCDIDMWIGNKGANDELNYGNMETAFGQLFRDVRKSGSISGDGNDYRNWECARINHNNLEDLTLWLNVYETRAPARIRLIGVCAGKRREKVIEMAVAHGDHATGRTRRDQSEAWKQIPLRSKND